MAKSLKLSKKHGLQPVIPICYYCGQKKQEIALLGAEGDKLAKKMGREDGEMPMTAVLDAIPCEECRKLGIAIAEIESETNQRLTGWRWVFKEEAIKRLLAEPMLTKVLTARFMFLPAEVAEGLGFHAIN